MPPPINMRSPDGSVVAVPEEQAQVFADRGYTVEDAVDRTARVADTAREEYYSTPSQKVRAGIAGVARGATLGLSDLAARAAGAEDTLRGLKEANPTISTVTEIGGSLLTGKLPGVGAPIRAGQSIAKAAEGASVVAKLGRAAAGAAVEGAAFGAGQGLSDVSLSADPLTLERAVSSIGSGAFFGGAVGGAAGLLTKGISVGGGKLAGKLDDVAAKAAAPVDDTARVAFADEVAAFRKQSISDELFGIVKGAPDRETRTLAKTWLEADKALDRTLRNPKALASNPKNALSALQQQEHALETVAAKVDDLRATLTQDVETFAMSSEGKVAAAKLAKLDKIAPALEQNRALQAKIAELTPKAPGASGGLGSNMLGGQAFGLASSVVGAIPVVGPLLAPIVGGAASKMVTDGLGKLAAGQAARMSKAVKLFVGGVERVAPVAPVLASKVMAEVSFAGSKKSGAKLADSHKRVTDEIKQMTQYDPTGRAVMRPDQRAQIYERLAPVRQASPQIADQIETIVARKLEALANRIPRRPDAFGMRTGPDTWQPSDLEMRAFARYVSAVEDPSGVLERVAGGTVTLEDRDALKEVYPEMFAEFQRALFSQLPTLQKSLPHQKRLALSIFSGVPVDPAMDPQVLSVLQGAYESEAAPPMPSPQGGSVKNHEATPSEARQGLGT